MTTDILTSKKGVALLIALANCDLIFLCSIVWHPEPATVTSMITATMSLAAVYVGGQSAVDAVAANKNSSNTQQP